MKEIALHINREILKQNHPYAKFDFEPEEKVFLHYNQLLNGKYIMG